MRLNNYQHAPHDREEEWVSTELESEIYTYPLLKQE